MSDKPKVIQMPHTPTMNPTQVPPGRKMDFNRVLSEYAKLHLELVAANEENATLRNALGGLQAQYNDEIAQRELRIQELEKKNAYLISTVTAGVGDSRDVASGDGGGL